MDGIVLEGLNLQLVRGGRTIVDLPHFQLGKGEVVGVIGANGAGKSSLIRLLAFLEQPTAGEVRFHGRRPVGGADTLAIRRRLAAVFQEPLLLHGTARHNVSLGLRLRGVHARESRDRALAWLETFGVRHLAGARVGHLSSGEAQRVSLARAFAVEPEVLFLDEPFANVDTPTRTALILELRQMLEKTSAAAVYVTHDFRELPQVADRVIFMSDGQAREAGRPEEILGRPVDPLLAAFVGTALPPVAPAPLSLGS